MNQKLPKCKCCKERFIPFNNNSLQKWCMKKDECIKAHSEWANSPKIKASAWRKEKAEKKIYTHTKEFKRELQNSINKLARMIDAKFGYATCIDCDKSFGKQSDGAHFHGRGSNSTLRYNLDNIHTARSSCNMYSDTHKQGYEHGLYIRYGKEYCQYVITELPLKYKEIHLNEKDIHDKLKIVRGIIKNFDTYSFNSSIQARKIFTKLIGIYN